jgi:hypothetical protein
MVGNTVERTLTCDGEAYLKEECGMDWYAKPGEAQFGPDTVTIEGIKCRSPRDPATGMNDHLVVITEGRGVGQSRLVVSNVGGVMKLAQPWRIQPDATSACIVAAGSCEETLVNNQAYDTNGCPPGFFFACAQGCIADGFIGRNTGSPYIWSTFRNMNPSTGKGPTTEQNGSMWDFYLKPDYFNQYLHGQYQDSDGVYLAAHPYGRDSQREIPGFVQLGNRISDCVLNRGRTIQGGELASQAATAGVKIDGPVALIALENNTLSDFDIGVRVSPQTQDILVRRNLMIRLGEAVSDPESRALVEPFADQLYHVDIGIGWDYPRPDGKNVGFLIGSK